MSKRTSYSLPDDVKQEIQALYNEGLNTNAISKYVGVSNSTVRNIVTPEKLRPAIKKYYLKNKQKLLARMREYNKEYLKNPEKRKKVNEKQRQYQKNRYHSDPEYREMTLKKRRDYYRKHKK